MKKLVLVFCVICLLISLSVPAFAGIVFTPEEIEKIQKNPNSVNQNLNNSEERYIYLWSEEDMCYMPYENPNYQKTFPYVPPKSSKSILSILSSGYELGITPSRQSYTVYSTASTSSPIGSIGSSISREIVRVNSETTVNGVKWYNITYKTSSGSKTGYIKAMYINIPSRTYSYSKACTSGTFTQDFGYNDHAGVDIGGTFSVYAVSSGTVNYKHTKFQHPSDNNWYLISYGNYAQQSTANGTATYAHLSAFASGGTISTLPSMQLSTRSSIVVNNPSRLKAGVASGSASPGAGGYLGTSGSTGNSSGAHLHIEIGGDPFRYVLFPDYGYVQ